MSDDRARGAPGELRVGLAQLAPAWLDRERTLAKVVSHVEQAADEGCRLVVFGEAFVPGYPFWTERTNGARFDSPVQKDLHAYYLDQAVDVAAGHLAPVLAAAADRKIAVVLGCVERAADRGGHTVYCALVFVDARGSVRSVHRKLVPTYEERLSWGQGDGHGLRVHRLEPFTVGCLNCWENWMPLVRAALYAQGEDLHVAIWPGGVHNTRDITRFIARESRSYVVSASALMRAEDIPAEMPHAELVRENATGFLANGGSCIAGPDGEWVVEPVAEEERLIVATLDHAKVRAERQNFDPAGHYARPDVTHLFVNRERQTTVTLGPDAEPGAAPDAAAPGPDRAR